MKNNKITKKPRVSVSQETIERVGREKNLRRLELPLDEYGTEFLEVIVCVPTRAVLSLFLKHQQANPTKAMEILVKNCLLNDHETVLTDDTLFFSASLQIAELIPVREGKIKKDMRASSLLYN